MKNILLIICSCLIGTLLFAQNDTLTTKKKIDKNKINLAGRSNDHLLLEAGYAGWAGKPDSAKTTGIPRTFNAYFMFDFPIKTSPRFSIAAGAGIATDNIYFTKTYVGLKDATPTLQFKDLTDTNHFKKYKLATAWLEAPIELRFSSNPMEDGKSVKFALGVKVGTLLNAHTKGKTYQDRNAKLLINYIQKENSKHYFNSTRLSVTGRIGYGHFSLFGSYQVTPLFKDGVAPAIRPFSIGLAISGL